MIGAFSSTSFSRAAFSYESFDFDQLPADIIKQIYYVYIKINKNDVSLRKEDTFSVNMASNVVLDISTNKNSTTTVSYCNTIKAFNINSNYKIDTTIVLNHPVSKTIYTKNSNVVSFMKNNNVMKNITAAVANNYQIHTTIH